MISHSALCGLNKFVSTSACRHLTQPAFLGQDIKSCNCTNWCFGECWRRWLGRRRHRWVRRHHCSWRWRQCCRWGSQCCRYHLLATLLTCDSYRSHVQKVINGHVWLEGTQLAWQLSYYSDDIMYVCTLVHYDKWLCRLCCSHKLFPWMQWSSTTTTQWQKALRMQRVLTMDPEAV